MDEVRVVPRGDLGERLDVVLEERELERARLPVLAARVRLPHPGRGVVVAGPLEELDRPVRLGGRVERRTGCGRRRRCCGCGGLAGSGVAAGSARPPARGRIARAAAGGEQRPEARRPRQRDEPAAIRSSVPSLKSSFCVARRSARRCPRLGLASPVMTKLCSAAQCSVTRSPTSIGPLEADLVVQAVHHEALAGRQLDDVLRHRAEVDDVGDGRRHARRGLLELVRT